MYQTSQGGTTYIPQDVKAKIVDKTSPRMAKILSTDYTIGSARTQTVSFENHHCFKISKDIIRRVAHRVADHIKEVEYDWIYTLPDELDLSKVHSISISRDGAMAHLLDAEEQPRIAGYKEMMCGTICFYDEDQNLLHRICNAVGSQSGKSAFNAILNMEIERVKKVMKEGSFNVIYVGVADGAVDNWSFLKPLTQYQVTDYYHVVERLAKVNMLLSKETRKNGAWLKEQKRCLLEEEDGAQQVLNNVKKVSAEITDPVKQEVLQAQITYLTNQNPRMNYYTMRQKQLPIGSGPVEAACKDIVKTRLGQSGMRWLNGNADDILAMRALYKTPGRMDQYWRKRMGIAA